MASEDRRLTFHLTLHLCLKFHCENLCSELCAHSQSRRNVFHSVNLIPWKLDGEISYSGVISTIIGFFSSIWEGHFSSVFRCLACVSWESFKAILGIRFRLDSQSNSDAGRIHNVSLRYRIRLHFSVHYNAELIPFGCKCVKNSSIGDWTQDLSAETIFSYCIIFVPSIDLLRGLVTSVLMAGYISSISIRQ